MVILVESVNFYSYIVMATFTAYARSAISIIKRKLALENVCIWFSYIAEC